MPVRVVYFGNSVSAFSARHFEALLASSCHLVAVVDVPGTRRSTTNPLPDGLTSFVDTAHQWDIPALEPANPNEAQFVQRLRQLEPDLFVSAGYAFILGEQILSVPRLLAANFHASLLPDYRGKHPVFWALRHGERWAGLTVHAMDPGIDTGDILYQVRVRTRRDDTVASLYKRIMDRSVKLVGRLFTDAGAGRLPRRPQVEGGGSYFSSTCEDDFHLNWKWPAETIRRHISMTPGRCFSEVNGERVYFHNAEIEAIPESAAPATVLNVKRTRAVIAAGSGAVSSSQVQVEGQAAESFAGFCRRMGLGPRDEFQAKGGRP